MISVGPLRRCAPLILIATLGLVLAGLGSRGAPAILSDQATNPGNTFTTGTWTTLYAIGDTYLKSGNPNQNQGTELFLRVRLNGTNRALIQFDSQEMSDAAAGKTLSRARVRLYIEDNGNNWGASGRTVDAHRVTVSWTELGATWNCPDDTDTGNGSPDCAEQWNGGTFNASATDSVLHTNGLSGWVEWDVTADVQDMVTSPATNYGWIVKKTEEGQTGRANYTSREGAANGPELFLVFEQ